MSNTRRPVENHATDCAVSAWLHLPGHPAPERPDCTCRDFYRCRCGSRHFDTKPDYLVRVCLKCDAVWTYPKEQDTWRKQ